MRNTVSVHVFYDNPFIHGVQVLHQEKQVDRQTKCNTLVGSEATRMCNCILLGNRQAHVGSPRGVSSRVRCMPLKLKASNIFLGGLGGRSGQILVGFHTIKSKAYLQVLQLKRGALPEDLR